jgi:hypothetical protein
MTLDVARRLKSQVRGVAVSVPRTSWVTWRKSSRSQQGNCLQVRLRSGHVQVRDSKDPHGAVLSFTPDEWEAFVAGVRDGEFDLPA